MKRIALSFAAFLALVAFVCSGFTASASWVVLVFLGWSGWPENGPSEAGLFAKAIVFTALFGTSIFFVRRLAQSLGAPITIPARPKETVKHRIIGLIVIVGIVAVVSGIRVSEYPHLEPDEAHHLIVARNLAVHGVYGSGMPSTGFRPFDDYDSVGPTVILPVAAAMKMFGARIAIGRMVMVAFFAALAIACFAIFSMRASILSGFTAVLFLLFAPGSLYLSRTLYGEAPALLFLLAGLIVWNRALHAPKPVLLCIFAGCLFGGALITKYFLVVAIWPGMGMWFYDYVTAKRVRVLHAIVPAAVAVSLLGIWVVVTSVYGPHGDATAAGHLSMYQYNLLFGVSSLRTTLGWLAQHWIATTLYLVAGLCCAVLMSMRDSYNPAWLFLSLFAAMNAYWWIFFTTGGIPRYAWYGFAIGAMFAGCYLGRRLEEMMNAPRSARRWATCAIVACVVALVAWDAVPRLYAITTRDEMRDEYALADTVNKNYAGKKIATTFYPVERLLNLLGEIKTERVKVNGNISKYDLVIVDRTANGKLIDQYKLVAEIGRYALLEPNAAMPAP